MFKWNSIAKLQHGKQLEFIVTLGLWRTSVLCALQLETIEHKALTVETETHVLYSQNRIARTHPYKKHLVRFYRCLLSIIVNIFLIKGSISYK